MRNLGRFGTVADVAGAGVLLRSSVVGVVVFVVVGGVGEGGIAGSAHRSLSGVRSLFIVGVGVGEGGIAGSAHRSSVGVCCSALAFATMSSQLISTFAWCSW